MLVILGLLTGGILTGQSLIRAAELRAVTTEFEHYQTAVNTFKQKYFALPGDMPNATQFWGRADAPTDFTGSQCANPSTNTGAAPATCNGNGDGIIRNDEATRYESFRAWQHLINAGLTNATVTGRHGNQGTYHHVVGENIPTSNLTNAGWGIVRRINSSTNLFNNSINKLSLVHGATLNSNNSNFGGVILPEEAWNIDIKMDDGKPGTGKILSHTQNASDCPTSNNQDTANYDLAIKDKTCSLIFLLE